MFANEGLPICEQHCKNFCTWRQMDAEESNLKYT
jgi:hypothetical protein